MAIEFTAYSRKDQGRGGSRRVRRSGKAPGIVYGGTQPPAPIEIDHNALVHALKSEAFHSSILSMKLDGAGQKVLLRDIQMHPFREQVLHIDFQRVDETRRVHVRVPLHFVNQELAPAVKLDGARVTHVMTELDVTCLPKDLPEYIEVDLSQVTAGSSIHVSALKLPAGVNAVRKGREDPVVATAAIPRAIEEAEPAAATAAAAAPAAAGAAGAAEAGKPDAKAGAKPDAKAADKGGGKKDDKK